MARCCGERAAFPHTPPSILSTQPSVALAPAPGPEEISAAGAHSCSPCSIYCFQFNVRRSWAGQHGGNMVMPSCAKPAWTKILPSHLGWLPFPCLKVKPTRRPGWPCGVGPGRGAGPAAISLCSLEAELEAGLARQGSARRWDLGSRAHSGGCKVVDGSSLRMAPQSLPKEMGLCWHPRATAGGGGGWQCPLHLTTASPEARAGLCSLMPSRKSAMNG